jgi:ATPase subunit of ABC transporter with duplicated ATPase domains
LFSDVTLSLERERLGIVGPNGSGKTTLLEIMAGALNPQQDMAKQDSRRFGYVSQHANNWLSEESLLAHVLATSGTSNATEVARQLAAHRFPLALAERPLSSLSPGERTRAALICLFLRDPPVEVLLLDEPTDQLDLLGIAALEQVLTEWPGGLAIVSHERELLGQIGAVRRLELGFPESRGPN